MICCAWRLIFTSSRGDTVVASDIWGLYDLSGCVLSYCWWAGLVVTPALRPTPWLCHQSLCVCVGGVVVVVVVCAYPYHNAGRHWLYCFGRTIQDSSQGGAWGDCWEQATLLEQMEEINTAHLLWEQQGPKINYQYFIWFLKELPVTVQ